MESQPVIRRAVASDNSRIASIHVRAWQATYRGHMPDHFLHSLDPASRAGVWANRLLDPARLVLVADDAPDLRGFCSLIPSRDSDAKAATAELSAIYVDPSCLRLGIGSLLLENLLPAARARGFDALSLWVLRDNAPALAFYQARGFIPDGTVKTQTISTFQVQELRMHRSLLTDS
ncbi:MAG: GNAT family N-acetyltransferase [Polyangiaceae bacterium]